MDLTLDLPDAVEILVDADAVGRPDHPLEARDVFAERIEQAGPASQRRLTLGEGSAHTEEALEHDARMCFRRKGRGR